MNCLAWYPLQITHWTCLILYLASKKQLLAVHGSSNGSDSVFEDSQGRDHDISLTTPTMAMSAVHGEEDVRQIWTSPSHLITTSDVPIVESSTWMSVGFPENPNEPMSIVNQFKTLLAPTLSSDFDNYGQILSSADNNRQDQINASVVSSHQLSVVDFRRDTSTVSPDPGHIPYQSHVTDAELHSSLVDVENSSLQRKTSASYATRDGSFHSASLTSTMKTTGRAVTNMYDDKIVLHRSIISIHHLKTTSVAESPINETCIQCTGSNMSVQLNVTRVWAAAVPRSSSGHDAFLNVLMPSMIASSAVILIAVLVVVYRCHHRGRHRKVYLSHQRAPPKNFAEDTRVRGPVFLPEEIDMQTNRTTSFRVRRAVILETDSAEVENEHEEDVRVTDAPVRHATDALPPVSSTTPTPPPYRTSPPYLPDIVIENMHAL